MENCTQVLEDSAYLNYAPEIGRMKMGSLMINEVSHDIFRGDNVIGRDEQSNIVIRSAAISNKHAVIEVDDWDTHLVQDCGSTNKTRLGKMTLKPNAWYNLQGGDDLMFANLKAKYTKLEKPQALVEEDSGSETGSESMLNLESVSRHYLDVNDSGQTSRNLTGISVIDESKEVSDPDLDTSSVFENKNEDFTSHIQVVDASRDETDDDDMFILPSQTVKEFKLNQQDKISTVDSLTEDIFDPATGAKRCKKLKNLKPNAEINYSKDIFQAEMQDQDFDGVCENRNSVNIEGLFNTEAQLNLNDCQRNPENKLIFEAETQEIDLEKLPTQKQKKSCDSDIFDDETELADCEMLDNQSKLLFHVDNQSYTHKTDQPSASESINMDKKEKVSVDQEEINTSLVNKEHEDMEHDILTQVNTRLVNKEPENIKDASTKINSGLVNKEPENIETALTERNTRLVNKEPENIETALTERNTRLVNKEPEDIEDASTKIYSGLIIKEEDEDICDTLLTPINPGLVIKEEDEDLYEALTQVNPLLDLYKKHNLLPKSNVNQKIDDNAINNEVAQPSASKKVSQKETSKNNTYITKQNENDKHSSVVKLNEYTTTASSSALTIADMEICSTVEQTMSSFPVSTSKSIKKKQFHNKPSDTSSEFNHCSLFTEPCSSSTPFKSFNNVNSAQVLNISVSKTPTRKSENEVLLESPVWPSREELLAVADLTPEDKQANNSNIHQIRKKTERAIKLTRKMEEYNKQTKRDGTQCNEHHLRANAKKVSKNPNDHGKNISGTKKKSARNPNNNSVEKECIKETAERSNEFCSKLNLKDAYVIIEDNCNLNIKYPQVPPANEQKRIESPPMIINTTLFKMEKSINEASISKTNKCEPVVDQNKKQRKTSRSLFEITSDENVSIVLNEEKKNITKEAKKSKNNLKINIKMTSQNYKSSEGFVFNEDCAELTTEKSVRKTNEKMKELNEVVQLIETVDDPSVDNCQSQKALDDSSKPRLRKSSRAKKGNAADSEQKDCIFKNPSSDTNITSKNKRKVKNNTTEESSKPKSLKLSLNPDQENNDTTKLNNKLINTVKEKELSDLGFGNEFKHTRARPARFLNDDNINSNSSKNDINVVSGKQKRKCVFSIENTSSVTENFNNTVVPISNERIKSGSSVSDKGPVSKRESRKQKGLNENVKSNFSKTERNKIADKVSVDDNTQLDCSTSNNITVLKKQKRKAVSGKLEEPATSEKRTRKTILQSSNGDETIKSDPITYQLPNTSRSSKRRAESKCYESTISEEKSNMKSTITKYQYNEDSMKTDSSVCEKDKKNKSKGRKKKCDSLVTSEEQTKNTTNTNDSPFSIPSSPSFPKKSKQSVSSNDVSSPDKTRSRSNTKKTNDKIGSRSSSRSGSVSSETSVSICTVGRSPRKSVKKCEKVLFTMLSDPTYEANIKVLGGSVVDSPDSCTMLVTEKVRRTVKFLCVLGQGKPIVDPEWIVQSYRCKGFKDPMEHLLLDKEAERRFNFNLRRTIQESRKQPLLTGYTVYATPNVKPDPFEIESIVDSCGGKYLSKVPSKWSDKTIVISHPDDKSLWKKLRVKGSTPPIVAAEFLLLGVLQHKIDIESHKIL